MSAARVEPFPWTLSRPLSETSIVEEAPFARKWGFRLTMLYLIIEYLRPQDSFGPLAFLRPGLVVSILLMFACFSTQRKPLAHHPLTQVFLMLLVLFMAYIPFTWSGRSWIVMQGSFQVLVAYLGLVFFTDSIVRFERLWMGLLIGTIILGIKGIKGGGSAGGYFLGDENDFCLLMDMLLPFCYFPILGKVRLRRKLLAILAMVICLAAIISTNSRGGFVGLVLVGAFCWWKSPKKGVALGLILVLVLTFALLGDEKYWKRLSTIGDPLDSTRLERKHSWWMARQKFLRNPLGVGPNNFGYCWDPVKDRDLFMYRGKSLQGRQAHSLYFTALTELGIFGLVLLPLFAVRLWRVAKTVLKSIRDQELEEELREVESIRLFSLAIQGSLVAYLGAGVFISVLSYPHFYVLAGLALTTSRLWDQVSSGLGGRGGPSESVGAAQSGPRMNPLHNPWLRRSH